MKKICGYLFLFLLVTPLLMESCGNESKKPPVTLTKKENRNKGEVVVSFSENGGVKTIPVKINGVALDMIFDTGCSGMSMSLAELQILVKNGKITESDFNGFTQSQIADGSIVDNAEFVIREVEIAEGIIIRNVRTGVALNQSAPVLLGNGVLDEQASYEVDNVNKVIKFKPF